MIAFRVYYADGSTWDGDVGNAPFMHVLLIQEHDDKHGRRIVPPADFYVYHFDRRKWLPVDEWGMMQYLATPGTLKRVLMGERVFIDEWGAVLKRAKEDPDFPPRIAWYPDEPKEP